MTPIKAKTSGVVTFDYERLNTAIAIRDRSYKLLLWISDAIDKGLIQPSNVAHNASACDAATEWLRRNYHLIPDELRPNHATLGEFAAFFSTYLTSSFDVVEKPGTQGKGPVSQTGCRCELCMRIVNAPHLQAKKLYTADKRYAELLMTQCLVELARDNGLPIDDESISRLVIGAETRRAAAYMTYGHWLIRRLKGESPGASILALWRLIAWDPRGGMRRGFTLELNDFMIAEKTLFAALRANEAERND